ncbi:aconitate hydratase [Candidatus Formimonas warabiya]|uniref:Aconitate hydratase n=1 Tax=Formimonas warabiya TaxID=1761012 RepID=A0A3G1KXC5_FORW1|nr:aconitate hydratase [Candidatus Formimonas warabiya]ATW27173.1 aconitate hydratase [Candidatus Formimonas warabiya]
MGLSLAHKIIHSHLVEGSMEPGKEIALRVDQTLTQDATGTMAWLQFEALGLARVKTELSITYVDHNTLQTGFENADDHRFLQDMTAKFGAYYSRPGNGICHQLHLERFGKPGKTLLGADSHTPTCGALGMLAIGVGGLDVALAMGGVPFSLVMPKVINVQLHGRLAPGVSAKDVILEVLRRLSTKGGLRAVLEYSGDGLQYLSVPERATITNMGAETGATASIFPSDEKTREFLAAQGRESDWCSLGPDADAHYDQVMEISLGDLSPLVACPHSPDQVKEVTELAGMPVDQVVIGSCTNSSYLDLVKVARIFQGGKVSPGVSLVLAPGSKQVLTMISEHGYLGDMLRAGARILECTCGPCIGMGQSPPSAGVSLRTNNRNFKGRSGTADAQVYLVSPETAAASALEGKLTDPRKYGDILHLSMPEKFMVDDGMVIPPQPAGSSGEVRRGPNIKPLPLKSELPAKVEGEVLIKVGDHITTDHIMPAGAKILPLRSNIPAISRHVFGSLDPTFAERALTAGGGFIVGGENYGQGSSREHAALAPMYLGIWAVLAKSIARIHFDNLINFGIVPLFFACQNDYEVLAQGDRIALPTLRADIEAGRELTRAVRLATGKELEMRLELSQRQRVILLSGGSINWVRLKNKEQ